MQSAIERELRPELNTGEKLLWSGQPGGGLRLRPADAMLIPFSLMWGGFAIFWELSVFRAHAPFFFRLWGIPFVLVGLYLIAGRFFADARQRARTYYGVTNERVLIVSGLFQRQVKSLALRSLPEVTLNERGDRSGSITFGSAPPMAGWLGGSSWPGAGKQLPPSFEMIESVRQVYGHIQTAQRALQPVGA
jgi:Bacterial PH domain